jgi:hypothetical protein
MGTGDKTKSVVKTSRQRKSKLINIHRLQIPDMFYLPELLVNSEGFNFGTKQNGEPVGNVVLPAWARGCPRLFVKIHRQALESWHVRGEQPKM